MKFLVDQNLSLRLAALLQNVAEQAVRVDEVGLGRAADDEILEYAETEGFVIVTQDSDFGTLLAISGANFPSVIQLRGVQFVRPPDIAAVIIENLPQVMKYLEDGAIVTITEDRLRVRSLPIA